MTYSLNGKTAIVTGATSGMGHAAAIALRDAGANVVAGGRNREALAALPTDERFVTMRADVTDENDASALVDRAISEFGALDIVFNVAGVAKEGSFLEDRDIWDQTLNTNFHGVVNVCRAAIPALQRAGGGSIVNWASTNSFESAPQFSAYAVSKAAVLMLSKALAIDYAPDNIRVHALCPGYVDTPLLERHAQHYRTRESWLDSVAAAQPLGMASPESVADVAVFLASDASRIMTGSAVLADGGWLARAASVAPPTP
ncbi:MULTISPECIES: SDR family oxidoreductase [Microbacterium]|uniref:SDR family NAD(P)-dependent oxidoreductase n=1 Tax=Microbacterium TaxID=33882 RepID=UPI000D65A27C|nr:MULTISPECIES: SDR family oxidoreductase [Microbacterium]